ncbi:MAG TPA: DNA repair protein RecO [Planctomycetes bacterium]|nr:DNA repair protein RecO [Planctomycetaceae bacterium]HIN94661.1 DNA repair protein RecO [Planctomycetota bacterium]
MSTEKSRALVLRLVDFSESSCVVTLFTDQFGKIAALAKGARRPKGPFESALDLLAICRVVFLHKSSDTLDLLTEAKLEKRFRASTRDLSRLYAGYYIAELLNELTDIADPHPELFEEAILTLANLNADADVLTTIVRFELATLRLLGHLPTWDLCAGCGETVARDSRVSFGLLAGGVLCASCRVGQREVVRLQPEVIRELSLLSEESATLDASRIVQGNLRSAVRGLLNRYITNLIGHRIRMHDYLGMLAG